MEKYLILLGTLNFYSYICNVKLKTDKIMYDDYDDYNEENNDDTMRGWDPASEDDSKDNGMGRWSENNDERGWW